MLFRSNVVLLHVRQCIICGKPTAIPRTRLLCNGSASYARSTCVALWDIRRGETQGFCVPWSPTSSHCCRVRTVGVRLVDGKGWELLGVQYCSAAGSTNLSLPPAGAACAATSIYARSYPVSVHSPKDIFHWCTRRIDQHCRFGRNDFHSLGTPRISGVP